MFRTQIRIDLDLVDLDSDPVALHLKKNYFLNTDCDIQIFINNCGSTYVLVDMFLTCYPIEFYFTSPLKYKRYKFESCQQEQFDSQEKSLCADSRLGIDFPALLVGT